MRPSAAVAFAIVLALPAVAGAQPGAAPLAPPGMAPPPPSLAPPTYAEALERDGDEKSEAVALGLSIAGTAAGYAMMYAVIEDDAHNEGLTLATSAVLWLGPSAGHWYGGKVLTRGLGIRTAGAGLAFIGAMMEFSECFLETDCEEPEAAKLLVGLGAIGWVWGTLDDIVTAPGRVRRYNDAHRRVAVVPTLTRDSAGLALAGEF
jgi:hypothetical protein